MSSKGSDGHSLAITAGGQVYSWGDGKVNCSWMAFITHRVPSCTIYVHTCRYRNMCYFSSTVVQCTHVCTYMHLYMSWSNYCNYCLLLGNYGKLGHGDTTTQKIPKLISFFEGKVLSFYLRTYSTVFWPYRYL